MYNSLRDKLVNQAQLVNLAYTYNKIQKLLDVIVCKIDCK